MATRHTSPEDVAGRRGSPPATTMDDPSIANSGTRALHVLTSVLAARRCADGAVVDDYARTRLSFGPPKPAERGSSPPGEEAYSLNSARSPRTASPRVTASPRLTASPRSTPRRLDGRLGPTQPVPIPPLNFSRSDSTITAGEMSSATGFRFDDVNAMDDMKAMQLPDTLRAERCPRRCRGHSPLEATRPRVRLSDSCFDVRMDPIRFPHQHRHRTRSTGDLTAVKFRPRPRTSTDPKMKPRAAPRPHPQHASGTFNTPRLGSPRASPRSLQRDAIESSDACFFWLRSCQGGICAGEILEETLNAHTIGRHRQDAAKLSLMREELQKPVYANAARCATRLAKRTKPPLLF